MITEFIDGLQQFHFTECPDHSHRHRDCRWSRWMLHYFKRHVSHGRRYLTRSSSWCGSPYPGHQFLYWRYCLWPPGVRPITYIKSNSIIKSDTAIGITFSSFLALGVILIESLKVPPTFSTSSLGISWPSKTGICG